MLISVQSARVVFIDVGTHGMHYRSWPCSGWITVQSARVSFFDVVTHGSDSRVRADAWLSCFFRGLPRICARAAAQGSSTEQSAVSLLLTDYC